MSFIATNNNSSTMSSNSKFSAFVSESTANAWNVVDSNNTRKSGYKGGNNNTSDYRGSNNWVNNKSNNTSTFQNNNKFPVNSSQETNAKSVDRNVSQYSRSNNRPQRQEQNNRYNGQQITLKDTIIEWVKKINKTNTDEMIRFFESNKARWNFKMKEIVKQLAHHHKSALLDYVLKHERIQNTDKSNKKYERDFSLYGQAIWKKYPNESFIFDEIKEVFDVLIANDEPLITLSTKAHSVDEVQTIEKRLENSESFLGALLNSENLIDQELREQLYHYFTEEFYDRNHFSFCIRVLFNLITIDNSILFRDNLLFLLSRNIDEMSEDIFKSFICAILSPVNKAVLVRTLLSNPTDRVDMTRYFRTKNISQIHLKFVQNVIKHFHTWIPELITTQQNSMPEANKCDIIQGVLSDSMIFLGIVYQTGIVQDDISNLLLELISKPGPELIKPIGTFLKSSEISLKNAQPVIIEIVRKLTESVYTISSKLIKFNMELILCEFSGIKKLEQDNINKFIRTGLFVDKKLPVISTTKKSNSKFAYLSDEDEDENEDEVLKQESEPEPEEIVYDFEDVEYPDADSFVRESLVNFFKTSKYDWVNSIDDLKHIIKSKGISSDMIVIGILVELANFGLTEIELVKRLLTELGFFKVFSETVSKYSGYIDEIRGENPNINISKIFD